MSTLVAEARFTLPQAAAAADHVAEHLREHGIQVSRKDGRLALDFGYGKGSIQASADTLVLRAESSEQQSLLYVKSALASHVLDFVDSDRPVIEWKGAGEGVTVPPNFRLLTVAEAQNVTPHMRRITFRGENLAYYDSNTDYHVKLLIPSSRNHQPEWPSVGPNGIVRYPQGDSAPLTRKYTIRGIDVERGTLDIDFVMHDDAGPGSKWAEEATEGDVIGVLHRSSARDLRPADWYLLAGDETALPAIARMLDILPDTARGVALIEVADEAEEQPLADRPGIATRWLHRNGAAAGTTTLLQEAVRAVDWPADGTHVHVWIGAEFDAFKDLRAYIRKERGVPTDNQLIVAYWRKGKAGEEARHEASDG